MTYKLKYTKEFEKNLKVLTHQDTFYPSLRTKKILTFLGVLNLMTEMKKL